MKSLCTTLNICTNYQAKWYFCEANDNFHSKYLKTCNTSKVLALKLNCKVLVIQNLDNGLVNGLTGKVVKINEDGVDIVMDDEPNLMHNFAGRKFTIQKYSFQIYNEHNNLVGNRLQLPIKLGYSITVDKAQGKTLDGLVVDCYNFWCCGQLGMAIGRATRKETLQVQNC